MKEIEIPEMFLNVPYNLLRNPSTTEPGEIQNGANCEYYVRELLREYGYAMPSRLRSSELWSDTDWTKQVAPGHQLQVFDITFFNFTEDPYGAHQGLYIGEGNILHLARHIGYPAVWSLDDFGNHERYKVFIGAKRPLIRNPNMLE